VEGCEAPFSLVIFRSHCWLFHSTVNLKWWRVRVWKSRSWVLMSQVGFSWVYSPPTQGHINIWIVCPQRSCIYVICVVVKSAMRNFMAPLVKPTCFICTTLELLIVRGAWKKCEWRRIVWVRSFEIVFSYLAGYCQSAALEVFCATGRDGLSLEFLLIWRPTWPA
jgi:hypothetical protein